MRRIQVEKLKSEMVLAKPIYTQGGVILLKEGTVLTDELIDKVMRVEIDHIYISDALSAGIEVEDLISEDVRQATQEMLHRSMAKMHDGYFIATSAILEKVERIVSEVLDNPHVMYSIQEIRSRDSYAYQHAINVCLIALLIGKKMAYNDAQLKHLALGAVLHDVGKTLIDEDLTSYRDAYLGTEITLYKQHVRRGYEIIKNMPGASLLAANVALSHHEHYDGTGFPLGKKNTGIHEFARIVAVANEYDNLLYNDIEDKPTRHYELLELMVSRAYTWFDPEIIKIFSKSISPYPISIGVVLSDGRVGIVSKLNDSFPTRPVVRLYDEETKEVVGQVDLSKELNLMIVDEKDIDG